MTDYVDDEPFFQRMSHEEFSRNLDAAKTAMDLDIEFDGCPCFALHVSGDIVIEGHCWRVCEQCPGCGLHYTGTLTAAERGKLQHLFTAMDWYGKWRVVKGLR